MIGLTTINDNGVRAPMAGKRLAQEAFGRRQVYPQLIDNRPCNVGHEIQATATPGVPPTLYALQDWRKRKGLYCVENSDAYRNGNFEQSLVNRNHVKNAARTIRDDEII
jgi:hypothetical protein